MARVQAHTIHGGFVRVLWRLLQLLRKYWGWVILAYVCLLGTTLLQMAVPWLIKEVIDVGLGRRDRGFLVIAAGIIIALSVGRGIMGFGLSYLGEFLSQRVAYDLRNRFYDRVQRLSFAYHDNVHTGQLMSRATADVEGVRWFINMVALRIAQFIALFVLTCVVLFVLNWQLALVVFGCLPVLAFVAVRTSTHLRPVWLAAQQGVAEMGTVLQENLTGVRVVRAFAQEANESRKFGAKAKQVFQANYEASRLQAFNAPLMTLIVTLATALILWYGGRQVIQGQLTLGGLVAFNAYLAQVVMPVRMVGPLVNVMARAMSSGERIFEVIDAESAVKEKPGALNLGQVRGELRFEHVSFGYNSASPVLSDVSFAVGPGKTVALVGSLGSGKSTVVNLVPRFYDVTAGRITIDGVDVRDVTLSSLRASIGIVQQDIVLFSATIRDNIAYGATEASDVDIVRAATAASIHDFITSLPGGYDTWVGERGVTLSGGQKQRVAIARTLLVDPRIVIFDDSTSSVDTETEHLIQQALAHLMKDRTAIVIAHRLRTVMLADEILVLHQGRVVERGTHSELLQAGGMYRQVCELQLRDADLSANVGETVRDPDPFGGASSVPRGGTR